MTVQLQNETKTATKQTNGLLEKFIFMERDLNQRFLERENEIRSMILALLSSKNVLLIGEPGTGKSALVEAFSRYIDGANYFQWLLNKTSDPSELLGPISVRAMENDRFVRSPKGKLPEAHFAFIDEVFKCNSATLNALLPIMNERIWYNDGKKYKVNLKMMIGASNEVPQDEGLEAFYDRFIFRHHVQYINQVPNKIKMLINHVEGVEPIRPILTLQDIEKAQQKVKAIKPTKKAINALVEIVEEIFAEIGLKISDRRLTQCIDIMKANAYLYDRKSISPSDVEPLVYVLYENPKDIEQIKNIVYKYVDQYKQKSQEILLQAKTVYNQLMEIKDPVILANSAIDAKASIEKLIEQTNDYIKKTTKEKGNVSDLEKTAKALENMVEDILTKCLNIRSSADAENNLLDLFEF